MQGTNFSLSQIILLSDGYSILEVWDDPYSHYPKGSSLQELWPLCTCRLEESIFFQLFTTLLLYVASSTNLFAKEIFLPCCFLSYSTPILSCLGLFLGKRTCLFSKAIFPCSSHSSIMVLPWRSFWKHWNVKRGTWIPWWWAGIKTLR